MNATRETPETLDARIEDLQRRHAQDVRTLYEWHAQDYYDEMLDLSCSKPEMDDSDVEVRPDFAW